MYPADRLLPRPTYRYLDPLPPELLPGFLVRRIPKEEAAFAEEPPGSGRLLLKASHLGSPALELARGLSCSLLGWFEVPDAGWVPASRETAAHLMRLWQRPEAPARPTPAELLLDPEPWGAYALRVADAHQQALVTQRGTFTCHVVHVPTCCNYWHHELRFHEAATQQWLHQRTDLSKGQREKTAEAIRAVLQEKRWARPVAQVPAVMAWPRPLFDEAAG